MYEKLANSYFITSDAYIVVFFHNFLLDWHTRLFSVVRFTKVLYRTRVVSHGRDSWISWDSFKGELGRNFEPWAEYLSPGGKYEPRHIILF
jgi:hypothetical protein